MSIDSIFLKPVAAYQEAKRRIHEYWKTGSKKDELDLSNLGLTSVPIEIGLISFISKLNLSKNRLTGLPKEIGQLKSLTSLELGDNHLTSLPKQIGELESLTFLGLDENQLTSLPHELGKLKSLKSLVLSNNQLTSLPEEIGEIKSLETIYLYENELTSLPEKIVQLEELVEIYVFNNRLTSLPEKIGRLKSLRHLNIAFNQLTSLPREIGQLELLTGLYLSGNRLTRLPEEIGQLKLLTDLYLSDNLLTTLPDKIGDLIFLKELRLYNNQLTSLPSDIRACKVLTHLFLHGNPGLELPPWVLGAMIGECREYGGKLFPAKPADILDYYFSIQNGQGRALREVKVILVGRGEVGKTTMVDKLQKKRFIKNRKRTDGISITPWAVRLPDGMAELSFWDFGGQEIMHGTHQFFMTHRSLYVVMVDGRHDRGPQDAEYWLKLVRAFGGDSPVLVVMNRQKAHSFSLDRQALAEKYGVNIDHFFATECEEEGTIRPLRAAVLAVATQILQSEELFPAVCWKVKERLAQMKEKGENYFSDEDYQKLCTDHGIEDDEQQKKLLRRLADLGTVVSFPEDLRLADLSVLNPGWATDGIYRVITDDVLRKKGDGVVSQRKLRELLPKKDWPNPKHVRYVVDLMQKFELCFSVDDAGKVLIPELLPDKTPPLGDWVAAECLVYQYQYTVLPHGILPRFITRTHQLSDGQQRWRSGVILSHGDTEARVQADYDANTLTVWVRGKHANARRELLAIIRHHFDSIHAAIKGLNPKDRVAVPGHPKVLIRYRDLIMDERNHKSHYTVTLNEGLDNEERKDWPIDELLNGVESKEERIWRTGQEMSHAPKTLMYFNAGAILDQKTIIEGDATNCQVGHQIQESKNRIIRGAAR